MRQLGSRYTLDRVIGRGGTGEVWLARDEADDPVAVKVLRPELVDDQEIVVRFLRERQVLRSVRNSHIVGVRDLVVEGDTLAIVMDYVARSDLRSYLRDHGGALAPSVAVSLARQMLDALAVVHDAGVVHRDVKPENVLIDMDDHGEPLAKLSDFGVSRLLDGVTLTRVSGLIGTPRYMAPELGHGADPSPASDLYSVGVVLYEMLAARPPFVGDHPFAVLRAHAEEEPDRPRGVPLKLWRIVVKLLAKDPAQRFPDARSAAEALERVQPVVAGLPRLATAPSESASTFTPGRRTTGGRRWRIPLLTPGRVSTTTTRTSKRDAFVAIISVMSFAAVATLAVLVTRPAPAAGAELAWLDSYDNFVVRRDWQLTGKHGDVFRATESIMVVADSLPVGARYLQVVPKEIAPRDTNVHFYGQQPATILADPVFDVPLSSAKRGTFGYLTYVVKVPARGATKARLLDWNRKLARDRNTYSAQIPSSTSQVVPRSTESVAPVPELVEPAAVPVPNDVLQALKTAVRTRDANAAILGNPTSLLQIGTKTPLPAGVTPAPPAPLPTTVVTDPSPPPTLSPPTTTTTTTTTPTTLPPTTPPTTAPTTSSSDPGTTTSVTNPTTSSSDTTTSSIDPGTTTTTAPTVSSASTGDTTPVPPILPV